MAIVYDPHATEPDTQSEYLNLLMRRRIPYRVIERAALTRTSLDGLLALLVTAMPNPNDKERSLIAEFANNGGLVVGGPAWTSLPGARTYKEDWPDPETVAKDLADAITSDQLPVRLFNASSILAHVASDDATSTLLVQLVNYATLVSDSVTVRVRGVYRTAHIFKPGVPPAELEIRKSGQRTEVRINGVAVSAALLFEK
jgi:hypothetical protein